MPYADVLLELIDKGWTDYGGRRAGQESEGEDIVKALSTVQGLARPQPRWEWADKPAGSQSAPWEFADKPAGSRSGVVLGAHRAKPNLGSHGQLASQSAPACTNKDLRGLQNYVKLEH